MVETGLKDKDLEKPGAHVLIGDDQNRLHVLVKESAAAKAKLDTLEAEVQGAKGVKISVADSAEQLDLGDLGKWRDFVVEGISSKTPTGTPEAPVELHIFSAASKAEGVGSAFYTSLDLGYALGEVLLGEQLA